MLASARTSRRPHRETHLSAQSHPARADARIPGPDEVARRSPSPRPPAGEGPRSAGAVGEEEVASKAGRGGSVPHASAGARAATEPAALRLPACDPRGRAPRLAVFPRLSPGPVGRTTRPSGHHRHPQGRQSGAAQPHQEVGSGMVSRSPGAALLVRPGRDRPPRPAAGPGSGGRERRSGRGRRGLAERTAIALLQLLIAGYRLLLSPWLGGACRFHPSCSEYARQSLERHGLAHGTRQALFRLARCRPYGPGGLDLP